jgi:hypothetical protein
MRRRKTWLCFQLGIWCAAFWVIGIVYLWALASSVQEPTQIDFKPRSVVEAFLKSLSAEESTQIHWAGIAVVIFGVLAILGGVFAVVLRLTERPRETFVKRYSADDFQPPVIHARHE